MGALLKLSLLMIVAAVGWKVYQSRQRPPAHVDGFFLPQYRPVADLYRKYVEDGTEQGSSFSVYYQGEPLVNLWGGYADPDTLRPWQNDTLTIVWSSTKGVSAVALAMLVDRGLLDYKAEIRKYWPEFDQNGKSNITVEMLLSHKAGLSSLGGQSIHLLEYKHDWPKVEKMMATAPPDFPPGSMVSYQAITFAMYVDALIRKVDPKHRTLTQFFDEEIAKPFGIDFFVGVPRQEYYRTTRNFLPTPWETFLSFIDPVYGRLMYNLMVRDDLVISKAVRVVKKLGGSYKFATINNPYNLEVGIGSMMGFGSPGSLAKLYSILANGGSVGGKKLLSKPLVDTFTTNLNEGLPTDFEIATTFSTGFMVSKNHLGDVIYGHPGHGAQQGTAHPKHKLGFSYNTNFLWAKDHMPSHTYQELQRVFYDCFQKHNKGK